MLHHSDKGLLGQFHIRSKHSFTSSESTEWVYPHPHLHAYMISHEAIYSICYHIKSGPPRGWGRNRGYFPGAPKLLRSPIRLLDFYLYGLHIHGVYLLLFHHCLDSMSERLGRIISNAFTFRVDKHCKHVELTLFINCHTYYE